MCSVVYCGAAGAGAWRLRQDVRAGLAAADAVSDDATYQLLGDGTEPFEHCATYSEDKR
jgi:hypothetical protein